MKVLIAGGSGLIGRELTKSLISDGHSVVILSRNPDSANLSIPGVQIVRWDGRTLQGWAEQIETTEAVVNLTGENISSRRWTKKQKERILSSRTNAGRAICQAVQNSTRKPKVLLQASGVGYYGVKNLELLDEDAQSGDDFLAGVSREWEASTQPVDAFGVRRVVIRSGVVLSSNGGALQRMILPFKYFIGGTLGSGKQWLSWIHIQDEVNAIQFLIENENARGAFNLSAQPVTNTEFAKITGMVMRRPAFFGIPDFILQLVFGEMSTVVLDGQRVSNQKLTSLGFKFQYPELDQALSDLLKDSIHW